MLLVTLAVKTVLSISQNRMDQITLNKQLSNHLNMDIINASSSFLNSCNNRKASYIIVLCNWVFN
jgi:hypothetical protein